ncbi:MAG: acetate--CoA ligase, partial [Gammaproteobacteria bacterium]|nr:acetate--CoA ligase [Gammaproteobacteria bacterium]
HPNESKIITYAELYEQVCKLSNVLKKLGIKKGERVCIYLPMIPEALIAMLACARMGAIHSVVFAGFSSDSLKNRILDAGCKLVITANEGLRGEKFISLKQNVDDALVHCPQVTNVIVVQRTALEISWNAERDVWYHETMSTASNAFPCEMIDSADPIFILHTSGSTGKPKGIVHTLGGYLVYVAMTFKYIFNYQDGDVYWCTADVGWITGHSYSVYGPLSQGATTLIFEGIPSYPDPGRFWQIIDKYNVNIFYTAPTALRALRREGDEWVTNTQRNSLKLLGSVGEPLNPDVWEWYYSVVGNNRCPIVDTWWQTETGGILISPIPGITPLKPGSVGWPFFGIAPAIVDDNGNEIPDSQTGKLIIKSPWPGILQTVYGDRQRYETYFKEIPGVYFTGDNASRDEEGYYWVTGRNDDVIKVSGHRIGSAEVENAFLTHPAVAEAAVVGIPHEIKGETIYAFITLKSGITPTAAFKKELINQVRNSIGAIATPEVIQWTDALPKTRSGKIMRRLLRKIANNDFNDLGDTSTLADPQVVNTLIKQRKKETVVAGLVK